MARRRPPLRNISGHAIEKATISNIHVAALRQVGRF
jgi:hypothetical protein